MESLAKSWLALQCQMINGVARGMVVLGAVRADRLEPTASWPEGSTSTPGLAAAARMALSRQRTVVDEGRDPATGREPGVWHAACPLRVDGRVHGVVALEVQSRPDSQQRAVVRLLQWGCAWLEFLLRRDASAVTSRLMTVVELVAAALEHERFQAAASTVVTELATRLGCERVTLGCYHRGRLRVQALSHSARYEQRFNLLRDIGAAMEETLDQGHTLLHPAPDGAPWITRAHEQLARLHGAGTVCTIPLASGGRPCGAITLERAPDHPFDPTTVELCESAAALLGPILETKRRDDRSLAAKAWCALLDGLATLFGPRRLGAKLATAAVVALALYGVLATGQYRIPARAALEGTVERAVVAPQNGYLATAEARAGDIVREGQVLGTLEDKDLRLERLKWSSQREQLLKQYRSALANRERAEVRILDARLAQAEAQIALLDEQLARTRFVAPFDGILVSGDLSQDLGSPVERGEVLFEVAPLGGYRVALHVDERDIAAVALGQRGELVLAGMPERALRFVVERVTPVATAREGRNTFRVEASLEEPVEGLRPGMNGVAKIEAGERRLGWIWTHRAVDWLRLQAWSWWP